MSHLPGFGVKIPMFLASLLLSLILWFAVQSTQPRGAQSILVKLDYQNLSEDLFITSIPEEVQVRVEAPEEELRQIKPERMLAVVDLKDATVGRENYDVSLSAPRDIPGEKNLIRSRVPITIEKLISRAVPVTVETSGLIPSDANLTYQASDVDPAMVTVTGPESEVRQVNKVRALLDLTQVTAVNLEQKVPLEVVDSANRPLPNVRPSVLIAEVRPGVSSAPEMKGTIVVPDFTGQPAFGFRVKEFSVSPNQVMVRGSSETLSRVSTVATKRLSLEGLTQTKIFDAEIDAPRGVVWVNPRKVRVRVVIEPIEQEGSPPTAPTTDP